MDAGNPPVSEQQLGSENISLLLIKSNLKKTLFYSGEIIHLGIMFKSEREFSSVSSAYLFVLVGRDSYKLGLFEHVRLKTAVR